MPAETLSHLDELNKLLVVAESYVNAIGKTKLITIVTPGLSDKVIKVAPYDLGNNDPERIVPVVEAVVTKTEYDLNGIPRHTVEKRETGRLQKLWQTNPGKFVGAFGLTYKIDTTVNDGQKELADFERVLQMHISRFKQVPEPIAYHRDVTPTGGVDLKTISIDENDVPLAELENYKPFEDALARRDKILAEIAKLRGGGDGVPAGSVEPTVGEEALREASAAPHVHTCLEANCDFVGKTAHGLLTHQRRMRHCGEKPND